MGLFEALFLLFVGLRLAGFIDWPWLVVFSPLLAKLAVLFAVAFCRTFPEALARKLREKGLD